MIARSFKAMGTTIEVWSEDDQLIEATRAWFEEVESVCSRFRPDSQLSLLNSSEEEVVVLSGILAEIVSEAQVIRQLTGGLVDVGVEAAVSAWGYNRSFSAGLGLDKEPAQIEDPQWRCDGHRLQRRKGTRIDLGGIAKGWACDRVIRDGLARVVSAGGDIRSLHTETIVPIIDPWGDVVTQIQLGAGALATSSVTSRRWRVGGREVSHIIDPRSLAPVESPILSATVVAGTTVRAEAGAKAVLLRGEAGLAWADSADWIDSALVVWHDGSVYATTGIEVLA